MDSWLVFFVFPSLYSTGGSEITDAGDFINAKYGNLGLTIYIWFTIGRLMCKGPPAPKSDKTSEMGVADADDDGQFYDDDFDTVVPDLVLDKFPPILVSYAGSNEK